MMSSAAVIVVLLNSAICAHTARIDRDLTRNAKIQTDLPKPLTLKEREYDRSSLGFVYGMLKMKGNSYTDTFCSRSEDQCATVDGYPGSNSHSELTYHVVANELEKTPAKEVSGEIRRLGDLGYFIFNDLLWSDDWKTFPIGADIEDHQKHRPTADLLMGSDSHAWNKEMIQDAVKKFFDGRKTMTKEDYNAFVTRLFHKILLNMELTEFEVIDFEKYKAGSMKVSLFPRWLVGTLDSAFGLSWARKQRELWLEKYEAAMDRDTRGIIPKLQGRDKRFFADLLLTSMTSAGGLSVPTVIDVVLGIVYGGETSPWKVEDRRITEANLLPLILETVRRYPAVVGFPSWSPDQKKRYVLNLAMALRDPRAWSDAEEFKLRPLSEYHKTVGSGSKIGVAWAEQAKGPNGLTPDSRGCPGQELSIVIVSEFLRHLMPMQSEWIVTDKPQSGIKIIEGPCAATPFTLTRGADPSAPCHLSADPEPTSEPSSEMQGALQVAELAGTTYSNVPEATKPKFQCPAECKVCCQQDTTFSYDETKFKCIMTSDKAAQFKIIGRFCKAAKIRNSDKSQAKAKCDLTDAEQDYKVAEQLPECKYE